MKKYNEIKANVISDAIKEIEEKIYENIKGGNEKFTYPFSNNESEEIKREIYNQLINNGYNVTEKYGIGKYDSLLINL
jgi:hypothetical protein